MATATKISSPSSPNPKGQDARSRSVLDRILGVCDAIYRFLASLKLAVFSLATLAAVLSYATFFESWYGAAAASGAASSGRTAAAKAVWRVRSAAIGGEPCRIVPVRRYLRVACPASWPPPVGRSAISTTTRRSSPGPKKPHGPPGTGRTMPRRAMPQR